MIRTIHKVNIGMRLTKPETQTQPKLKVKLSVCLTKHDSLKTYWGVEV